MQTTPAAGPIAGVAWYAAVVSTAAFFLALYLAWRDRAGLRIHASCNMLGFGSVYEPEQKYVVVNVANVGRRPITIKAVGLLLTMGNGELLLSESVNKGAVELLEGKSHPFAARQDGIPLEKVTHAIVVDQAGRKWKKRTKFRA